MRKQPLSLPVDSHIQQICDYLGQHESMILIAEPGAGKTTRVAPAILKNQILGREHPQIVLLQPRRVAAQTVAARIAEELNVGLGEEVGYHIRFDRKAKASTKILVVTEGILLRRLLDDETLSGVGCVILDEFHERSQHTDIAISLLRDLQQTIRPDLKIVVMSATMDPAPVKAFLGVTNVFQVPGRAFPVSVEYLNSFLLQSRRRESFEQFAAVIKEKVERKGERNTLVFLPGQSEIRRTHQLLEAWAREQGILLMPFHGGLRAEEQKRVFSETPQRRVILSTNIAETSVTLPNIDLVIDSGLQKQLFYNPQSTLESLDLTKISRASSVQRAGRAGRTAPGHCVRCWSPQDDVTLRDFDQPELHRIELSGVQLALTQWTGDLKQVRWFEAPPELHLRQGLAILQTLGAIDHDQRLTQLGKWMAKFPLSPRLARIVIEGCLTGDSTIAAQIASILHEPDFYRGQTGETHPSQSDLVLRLGQIEDLRNVNLERHMSQLLRIAKSIDIKCTKVDRNIHSLVWSGFSDRLVRVRPGGSAGRMVGGRGIIFTPESVARNAQFAISLQLREKHIGGHWQAEVTLAHGLSKRDLEALAKEQIVERREIVEDKQTLRVKISRYIWDLEIDEPRYEAASKEDVSQYLRERFVREWQSLAQSNTKFRSWMNRYNVARQLITEIAWPNFDTEFVEQFALIATTNAHSWNDIETADLDLFAEQVLPREVVRALHQDVPSKIQLPTQREVHLDYLDDGKVQLEVKLQEIFGWMQTPQIARGRVPLILVLLAPNLRPIQVTQDLTSFWRSGYFEVRKELRARYPKHSWPEDPLAAAPQRKGLAQKKRT